MSDLVWTQDLSVGIAAIDRQHRMLIDAINDLQASASGTNRLLTSTVLKKLVAYVTLHFTFEEALMQCHNYESLSEHRHDHGHFRNQIAGFQRRYDSGDTHVVNELAAFLKAWLRDHIMVEDKRYGIDLRAKGVC